MTSLARKPTQLFRHLSIGGAKGQHRPSSHREPGRVAKAHKELPRLLPSEFPRLLPKEFPRLLPSELPREFPRLLPSEFPRLLPSWVEVPVELRLLRSMVGVA